jgi:hypothetical protein
VDHLLVADHRNKGADGADADKFDKAGDKLGEKNQDKLVPVLPGKEFKYETQLQTRFPGFCMIPAFFERKTSKN